MADKPGFFMGRPLNEVYGNMADPGSETGFVKPITAVDPKKINALAEERKRYKEETKRRTQDGIGSPH